LLIANLVVLHFFVLVKFLKTRTLQRFLFLRDVLVKNSIEWQFLFLLNTLALHQLDLGSQFFSLLLNSLNFLQFFVLAFESFFDRSLTFEECLLLSENKILLRFLLLELLLVDGIDTLAKSLIQLGLGGLFNLLRLSQLVLLNSSPLLLKLTSH